MIWFRKTFWLIWIRKVFRKLFNLLDAARRLDKGKIGPRLHIFMHTFNSSLIALNCKRVRAGDDDEIRVDLIILDGANFRR